MEAEAVLNLFDSIWFCPIGALEKLPEPKSHREIQQIPSDPKVSRQISSLARSKSDELSSFATRNSSPDSVLKPHLQTIPSGRKFYPPAIPKRGARREKWLSKSLSELEFEEVKGFIDLGFVFSEEDEDPALLEIIPGLQKLGHRENEEKRRSEEASRMRPYLSEAWEFYEEKRVTEWRAPAARNEMEIKDSLRSWAHTVASAVR